MKLAFALLHDGVPQQAPRARDHAMQIFLRLLPARYIGADADEVPAIRTKPFHPYLLEKPLHAAIRPAASDLVAVVGLACRQRIPARVVHALAVLGKAAVVKCISPSLPRQHGRTRAAGLE